jgi:hypothetical protein
MKKKERLNSTSIPITDGPSLEARLTSGTTGWWTRGIEAQALSPDHINRQYKILSMCKMRDKIQITLDRIRD